MLSHSTTTLSYVFLLTLTLLSTSTTALPTTSTNAIAIFSRDTPISKRAVSGLSIRMFAGSNCDGVSAAIGNAVYDTNYIGSATGGYKSIQWLGRPLLNNEQVNTYRPTNDGDLCSHFEQLVPRNSGTGCHTIKTTGFDCVRLIHP